MKKILIIGCGLLGSSLLRAIQKKSEEGCWLLILELPMEIEPPWKILKEIDSLEIITIGK